MGIEIVCTGCGSPIGANQFSQSIGVGYCARCMANMQLQAQANSNGGLNDLKFYSDDVKWDGQEKEVFGETLREVPLIEVDK